MQRRRELTDYVIILSDKDNVATALVDLPVGDYLLTSEQTPSVVVVPEEIKAGFKLAISDIPEGQPVYKYGYVIGLARTDIKMGQCVHVHNMASLVGR